MTLEGHWLLHSSLKRAEPYGGLGLAIAQNRGIFSELRGSGKEILPKTEWTKNIIVRSEKWGSKMEMVPYQSNRHDFA